MITSAIQAAQADCAQLFSGTRQAMPHQMQAATEGMMQCGTGAGTAASPAKVLLLYLIKLDNCWGLHKGCGVCYVLSSVLRCETLRVPHYIASLEDPYIAVMALGNATDLAECKQCSWLGSEGGDPKSAGGLPTGMQVQLQSLAWSELTKGESQLLAVHCVQRRRRLPSLTMHRGCQYRANMGCADQY